MIVIGGAAFGAVYGAYVANKRGGGRLDIAQYSVASAIAFALLGLILTVIIHRTIVG